MDADFVVRFSPETKRRFQFAWSRAARTRRSAPWQVALAVALAAVVVTVAITSWSRGAALAALFFVGLAGASGAMAWIYRKSATLPMPDVAIVMRGDSVWLVGDVSVAGVVKRGDEVWPLASTTVAVGTRWGSVRVLVFTAPGQQPRRFSVHMLDQSAEEIVAQLEYRQEALLR